MRHCDICKRSTMHIRTDHSPNHILHLLLSIITVGLWVPIWIVIAISAPNENPVCSVCGGEMPEERIAQLKAESFADKWKRFFNWQQA